MKANFSPTIGKLVLTSSLTAFLKMVVPTAIAMTSTISLAAAIENSNSSVAILTDKEGIAAALAHRHIIVASNLESALDLGLVDLGAADALSKISKGEATVSFKVQDLIVDSNAAAQAIIPMFANAKVWNPSTDKLEEGNASTVKENMLDPSQLDAARFAIIEGKGRFDDCTAKANELECKLSLTLRVKDKAVTKQFPLIIKKSSHGVSAEFIGSFNFTDFGIKPYTTMFGAIAVKNQFYVAGKFAASTPK